MYQKGQLATLNDYNDIAEQTLFFYGVGYRDRGYGQNIINVDVLTPGQKYLNTADRWLKLRNAQYVCSQHQNTATSFLPPATEFQVGKLIKAYESTAPSNNIYDWGNQLDLIDQNRFNVGPLSAAVESLGTSITRNSTWGTTIVPSIFCDIEFRFDNEDRARYFFNSGGELRFSISHPVGNQIDNSWRNFLQSIVSEIRFSAHNTKTIGTHVINNSIGYYELTSSYQTLLNYNGNGGGYGYGYGYGNFQTILVQGLSNNITGNNGAQGSQLRFRITLTDSYTGVMTVSPGTNINTSVYKAVTYLQNIQTPTRQIIIDLN